MSSNNSDSKRPIQLLFRTKEAVELYTLQNTSSSPSTATKGGHELYRGKTTFSLINPKANKVYIHDANIGLLACDLSPNSPIPTTPFIQDSKPIQLAKCSPRGSYLLTWQRPAKSDGEGNLKIWDASTGTHLKSLHCKKATLDTLQWTHDESLMFHLVTNEIHIYDLEWRKVGRVRCVNVASFCLPTVKGLPKHSNNNNNDEKYLFTTFTPSKDKPSRIDLLRYPDRMGRDSTTTDNSNSNTPSGPPLTSKSIQAESTSVSFSPRADSALILTQTSIDSTGSSYYGSSHLFLLLECDNKNPTVGKAISVPLPKEATKDTSGSVPILCAEWIPNPQISGVVPFIVISGKMPALSSIHHGISGDPMFLLGKSHRNTVDISPHGRFLVCGGYGNLAGGMDFWDRNKEKLIPRHVVVDSESGKYVTMTGDLSVTSVSPVVGHAWSPDSRTYLVSTTSPRMNVENGVHLYRYDGSLISENQLPWSNEKYKPDKLLSAEYVPAPSSEEFYYYPDRPVSPPPRGMVELKGQEATKALDEIRRANSTSKQNGTSAAYVPPAARGGGAYVPPGARRAAGGGTSLAERMRQEREGSAAAVTAKKVRSGPVGSSSVGPVGSAPTEDTKSKNALRREKQRLAKEKAAREAAEAEQRKKDEEAARAEANKLDPEKRAKKIKKTLKQIEEIKVKAGQGVELNEDQKKKLEGEDELRRELAGLGL